MTSRSADTPPRMKADGPSVQDLLDSETRDVPEPLRDTSAVALGTDPIPAERYTSQTFFDLEIQKLWGRAWQMACREEDIPEVGDFEVYDIGTTSLLVVRVTAQEIRAYYNVCLHRGRMLKECSGHAVNFRCPFHGFTWNLDGSVKKITNAWDFEHVDPDKFHLPQVHVGRWGGFVFVNLDETPEPLESYLEDIPSIYKTRDWPLEDRVKVVHVAKTHACNWKVALEAFIEAFHVVATHPGAMGYLGDAFSQYDVWPGKRHYTRMISPRGLHSPHIGPLTEEEVYRQGLRPMDPKRAKTATLPEGTSARRAMADERRAQLGQMFGRSFDHITDSEALDTIQYHIFPNLVCWAAYGSFLVYRFLPEGTNPDRCVMDIMFLVPHVEGMTVVREPRRLGVDDSHHMAPELGGYCDVFDEDMSNLVALQRGLKSMRGPGATLGNYQEMRIRHFHQTIDTYVK